MPPFGLSGPPDIDKLREKGDVKGLIKALSREQPPVRRRNAAEALAELGDATAIDALIEALGDRDVCESAASAIATLGGPADRAKAFRYVFKAWYRERAKGWWSSQEAQVAEEYCHLHGIGPALGEKWLTVKYGVERGWRESNPTRVCDDGNETIQWNEGFLRPGGYLCCERCTDHLLASVDWEEAARDLERHLGPKVPKHILLVAAALENAGGPAASS